MKVLVNIFLLGIIFHIAGCGNADSGGGDMNSLFVDLENGLKNEDVDLFKKLWHAEGYISDLVGEGLSGEKFYKQGSRKKWFPKPLMDKKETVGKVEIVRSQLYAWEKDKVVDEIFFAVADGKILGGGENPEKVKALAERFNKGELLGGSSGVTVKADDVDKSFEPKTSIAYIAKKQGGAPDFICLIGEL